jgi:hypothetical protein
MVSLRDFGIDKPTYPDGAMPIYAVLLMCKISKIVAKKDERPFAYIVIGVITYICFMKQLMEKFCVL